MGDEPPADAPEEGEDGEPKKKKRETAEERKKREAEEYEKMSPEEKHDWDTKIFYKMSKGARMRVYAKDRKKNLEEALKEPEVVLKPSITWHTAMEGDDLARPVYERLLGDVSHRVTRQNQRLARAGRELKAQLERDGLEPPPPPPTKMTLEKDDTRTDEVVNKLMDQRMGFFDAKWVNETLVSDDQVRELFAGLAGEEKHLTQDHVTVIFQRLATALQISLNPEEYTNWLACAVDPDPEKHGGVDMAHTQFLIRLLLRTKPYDTVTYAQTEQPKPLSNSEFKLIQTPTKQLLPNFSGKSMVFRPRHVTESRQYASVLYPLPVLNLGLTVDVQSQRYTVPGASTYGKAFGAFPTLTGVLGKLDDVIAPFTIFVASMQPPPVYMCVAYPAIQAIPCIRSVRKADPRHMFLENGGLLYLDKNHSIVRTFTFSFTNQPGLNRLFLAQVKPLSLDVIHHLEGSGRHQPCSHAPEATANLSNDTGTPLRWSFLLQKTFHTLGAETPSGRLVGAPHGAMVFSDGKRAWYARVLCAHLRCCGPIWDNTRATAPHAHVKPSTWDIITCLAQLADFPKLLEAPRPFYMYMHALFGELEEDGEGEINREKFRTLMEEINLSMNTHVRPEVLREGGSEAPVKEASFLYAIRDVLVERASRSLMQRDDFQLSYSQRPELRNGIDVVDVVPVHLELNLNRELHYYEVKNRTDLGAGRPWWGWNMRGAISPVYPIPHCDHQWLKIPEAAKSGCVVYPVAHLQRVLDADTPNHLFIAHGGFIYFDDCDVVVQVVAFRLATGNPLGGQMYLSPPRTLR